MFSTIINRFFHFYFLLFLAFSKRWGHLRWRFSERKIHSQNPNERSQARFESELWGLSNFQTSRQVVGCFMLSLFHERLACSIFGLTKTTKFSLRCVLGEARAKSNFIQIFSCSCSIQNRSLLMVEAMKNAICQEKTTVTHAFSIKTSFFFPTRFFLKNKENLNDERRRNRIELYIPLNHPTAQQIRTFLDIFRSVVALESKNFPTRIFSHFTLIDLRLWFGKCRNFAKQLLLTPTRNIVK